MYLDERLNYKTHCAELVKKLNKCPFMFIMLKTSILDMAVLKSVYYAHVQSHLYYGILCWGNSVCSKDVFLVQKKIIRAMLGFRYKKYYKALVSCKELFAKLEILTLPSLFIYECCKFYRKYPNLFSSNSVRHHYMSRRKNDLIIENFAKSPKNNVIKAYNKLPKNLKEIREYNRFSKSLKLFLLEKCYYDINEYYSENWQS
jgi:hypothetical protein